MIKISGRGELRSCYTLKDDRSGWLLGESSLTASFNIRVFLRRSRFNGLLRRWAKLRIVNGAEDHTLDFELLELSQWCSFCDDDLRCEVSAKYGAEKRSRTVDLFITNELLYQLSYFGVPSLT